MNGAVHAMTSSTSADIDGATAPLGRFLVRASLPVAVGAEQHFNPVYKGRLGDVIKRINPDDCWFIMDGGPCIHMIVSIRDMADLPVIAETLWLGLSAEVEIIPALTIRDIEKARPLVQETIEAFRPVSNHSLV